jgi:ribose-phosphate pyrophosphokinase
MPQITPILPIKSTFKFLKTGQAINIKKFSDGMIQVTIPDTDFLSETTVEAFIKDSDGIIALAQIKNILDTAKVKTVNVILTALPFARQDRIMEEGDAFSLKVFANMLNALKFDTVYINDPHSDVFPAVIDNCIIQEQLEVLRQLCAIHIIDMSKYTHICSPDGGSIKKAFKIAKHFGKQFIKADKIRNTKTGAIEGTYIPSDLNLKDAKVLIVDDCLDGGRTFTGLAQKLKEVGSSKVDLFVTVGIFSYGIDCLREYIDNVYCYTAFKENVTNNEDTFLKYATS